MGSLGQNEDEPPDDKGYLPQVLKVVDYVDRFLKKSGLNEAAYGSLLARLSEAEATIPRVVGDKSAVRMLAGRRLLIQGELIKRLRTSA